MTGQINAPGGRRPRRERLRRRAVHAVVHQGAGRGGLEHVRPPARGRARPREPAPGRGVPGPRGDRRGGRRHGARRRPAGRSEPWPSPRRRSTRDRGRARAGRRGLVRRERRATAAGGTTRRSAPSCRFEAAERRFPQIAILAARARARASRTACTTARTSRRTSSSCRASACSWSRARSGGCGPGTSCTARRGPSTSSSAPSAPCVVLMVGARPRRRRSSTRWSELAPRHGAGVERRRVAGRGIRAVPATRCAAARRRPPALGAA